MVHETEIEVDGVLSSEQEVVVPRSYPRELDYAVPERVRSLFQEAGVCEAGPALRAAGVMYRATVEALADDLGAAGRTLYDKIAALAGQGLDADVVRDLHEARVLGNDSIHHGIEYSAEEVADVAELIREATFLIYVQPEERRKMREARRARHKSRGVDT